jgi:dihydrolipoamide dehydrogenase
MKKHDLVVIGAGPGGYVAAIRAAQLGLDTACIEKNMALGGTCLRVGCIPSKALLESSERYWALKHEYADHGITVRDAKFDLAAMLKRKDRIVDGLTKGVAALFKKNKVTHYQGHARILGPGRVEISGGEGAANQMRDTIECKHIVIASGSKPAGLGNIEFNGDTIATSTEALSYQEVPKRLAVIGAGYIGLELGSVWSRLGSAVTVIEYLDRILPGMDSELAAEAQKLFTRQGLNFRLGAKVVGAHCGRRDRRRRAGEVRPHPRGGRAHPEYRRPGPRECGHHARSARTHPRG